MSDLVLKIENLGKMYRLGQFGTGTLSHDLNRFFARVRGKEDPNKLVSNKKINNPKSINNFIWVLQNINLELLKGDILGIIGKNGAGKSTLLKILSQITSPTKGTIKIKGRVASLLEVGTGMHPEMTARQNIFLNGSLMGMRRHEIKSKLDEIIDFAGIQKYIDTPIKRFSSGMNVRLGFAIAAFLEPEILIVDEVLAVGDADFQKKCIGKMHDVATRGRTVLFVSHNMQAVNLLCPISVLLVNGQLNTMGKTQDVIRKYQNLSNNLKNQWSGDEGDDCVRLLQTSVTSKEHDFYSDEDVFIELKIKVLEQVKNLVAGFHLKSEFGETLAYTIYGDYNVEKRKELPVGDHSFKFKIPKNTLGKGNYTVQIDLGIHDVKFITQGVGDLTFFVMNRTDIGCRYPVQDAKGYASILRPNWEIED